jgi:hypothetical protein
VDGDSTRHHGTRGQAANHAPSLLAGDAAVLQSRGGDLFANCVTGVLE